MLGHDLNWLWTQGAFYAVTSSWLCFLLGFGAWSRRHACHQRWCWRIGRHHAGEFVVCRRHHPGLPNRAPSKQHIAEAHQRASAQ